MRNFRSKFSPPKYKKGDVVKTPSGKELEIESITYHMGANWYLVGNKHYAENEISKI